MEFVCIACAQVYPSMLEIEIFLDSDKLDLESADREEIKAIVRSRWDELHHPLHAAAYMLEPQFQHVDFEQDVIHYYLINIS